MASIRRATRPARARSPATRTSTSCKTAWTTASPHLATRARTWQRRSNTPTCSGAVSARWHGAFAALPARISSLMLSTLAEICCSSTERVRTRQPGSPSARSLTRPIRSRPLECCKRGGVPRPRHHRAVGVRSVAPRVDASARRQRPAGHRQCPRTDQCRRGRVARCACAADGREEAVSYFPCCKYIYICNKSEDLRTPCEYLSSLVIFNYQM